MGKKLATKRVKITKIPELPRSMSLKERLANGKSLREKTLRQSHADWKAPRNRRDPITLLEESSVGRIPHLLPIRYGRMLQTPFTFFRGAAAIMAADLASTPVSGIQVQLCGDCHLLNFGGFGTPERRIVFDLNDFDETLPGPWEWDVKRLVTSFIVAARNNGFSKPQARKTAMACAKSYRKRMAAFSEMKALEVWYASIDTETYLDSIVSKSRRQNLRRRLAKVIAKTLAEDDYPKLADHSGGKHRIRDNPPLIVHPPESQERDFDEIVQEGYELYKKSLPDDKRLLLNRFEIQDVAMKVVGVGSVGTWCGVILHIAGDRDPLFLQLKEARSSVLEPYLGKSEFSNDGQRVVVGQRIMQSASDIFLGWTKGRKGRHFYVRQLRDMKVKPQVEVFDLDAMERYAKFCGWALARAHAKSGDAGRISGYLGKSGRMDEVLTKFAEAYADQNEKDHQSLVEAVRKGRLEAYIER